MDLKITPASKYVALAMAAALLYALSTPLAKVLMECGMGSSMLAALLYVGAGLGMAAIYGGRAAFGCANVEPLRRSDIPYAATMIALDVAAPLLLMAGLSGSSPETVSLLNNFEIVATAGVAFLVFHERISVRLWAGIAVITAACILLSFENADGLNFNGASLLVLLACLCWGVENNCTSKLAQHDSVQVVMVKGFGSGATTLAIAFMLGERLPAPALVAGSLLLGFLAYGLSIYAYVRAQRGLGAACTSAYYALAPFAGVIISWLIFNQPPTAVFLVALTCMALGSWLALPKDENDPTAPQA